MAIRCARCNRILINPPKMIGGQTYGPVCFKKYIDNPENGHKRGKSAEDVQSLQVRTWGRYDEEGSEEDEGNSRESLV